MISITAGDPERSVPVQDPHARKFGLLDCEHAFCLGCIRGWRSNADASAAETVRRGGCLRRHSPPPCLCGCTGLCWRHWCHGGVWSSCLPYSTCLPCSHVLACMRRGSKVCITAGAVRIRCCSVVVLVNVDQPAVSAQLPQSMPEQKHLLNFSHVGTER